MPKIAIYFRMFSPYILARLNAAAGVAQVVGIEGSRRSSTYDWEPCEGEEYFRRITLFTDRVVEQVPNSLLIARVREALDREKPQVVVAGGWSHVEAVAMIGWARSNGAHVVIMSESTAHDFARSAHKEWMKRRVVRLADAALVGGEPQRNYIGQLGLPLDRVFIGYNAVDNAYFAGGADAARADPTLRQQLGLPPAYFLASGRFVAKKNHARLIAAYSEYRRTAGPSAWDLVLVGDGPLRAELEAQINVLGLGEHVHLRGFLQYDALPTLLAFAGAFVHVSLSEQWGLVVNEAMAAGLPVIVSRQCGCAHDLVADGVNGWTVDATNQAGIGRRLGYVTRADRAAMADAGRQIVKGYGPDRFATGLEAALRMALSQPPRRASLLDRLLLTFLSLRDTSVG
ncbi:MAG: glycosyltransferase family 4 protein [Alteraurantiacibacter sp.]